jgi:hypothetical protein
LNNSTNDFFENIRFKPASGLIFEPLNFMAPGAKFILPLIAACVAITTKNNGIENKVLFINMKLKATLDSLVISSNKNFVSPN